MPYSQEQIAQMYMELVKSGRISPSVKPYSQQPTILPPQQILTANGKASIDSLRMSPNSSVYIEDSTEKDLIWKCVSDSLGNVTSTPYIVTQKEQAPVLNNEALIAVIAELSERITKLEDENGKRTDGRTNNNTQTKGKQP